MILRNDHALIIGTPPPLPARPRWATHLQMPVRQLALSMQCAEALAVQCRKAAQQKADQAAALEREERQQLETAQKLEAAHHDLVCTSYGDPQGLGDAVELSC